MPEQVARKRAVIRAIWLYFWLLLFEGSLRKWVLPQFSNPLLIVRDPVLLWAYYNAMKAGIFPRNGFIYSLFILAAASTGAGLLAEHGSLLVTIFGVRANFLHLPLIFLMPRVLSAEDVDKFSRWILSLSLPMALLMAVQFRSEPGSVINAGLRGEFVQIGSAMGKIRPPGTFSFVSGPILFFPLVAAFWVSEIVERKAASSWLTLSAGTGMLVAMAVSGSRSLVISVALVGGGLAFACLIKPRFLARSLGLAAIAGFLGLAIGSAAVFKEGIDVFLVRVDQARIAEEASGGLSRRFGNSLNPMPFYYSDKPFFGHGIGLGTNVGAALLSAKGQFLLAEEEWPRVILESGYILGIPYILLRILISLHLLSLCLGGLRGGRLLPLLLLSGCGLNLASGQFGQPTSLGFAVFGGGLCLTLCGLQERKP